MPSPHYPKVSASFVQPIVAEWQTCPVVALVAEVALVRHRTVAGGIIGIVVLLVIIGVIVFLLVSRSKAKVRAENAERELANLKQAYAQLDDAYRQSQHPEPAPSVEMSQVPPRRSPAEQPSSLPRYPGTPPPPGPPAP